MRMLGGRVIGDHIGVEEDQIGRPAQADSAAVDQPDIGGREACCLVDGLGGGYDLQLADVAAEEAGKGTEASRMSSP